MNNLLSLFSILISTGVIIGAQEPIVIWNAGESHEVIVSSVEQLNPQQLKLRFHPLTIGLLEALWTLAPGEKSVMVSLSFTPTEKGQFSLGYFLFNRKPLDQVDELLMPMLVNAKQFPSENYTLLQTQAPTTMSLMQIEALGWAVSVDPGSTPFECPVPAKSRDDLRIKNGCWGTLIEDSDWNGAATYDDSFAIYSRSQKLVIAGNITPGKMNP